MKKRFKSAIAVCAILCVAVIVAVASYRVKRDLLARQPASSSRLVAEYFSPRIVEDGNTVFVRVYTYIRIFDGKHGERLAKQRYRIIALDTTDGTFREVYQNQFNRYLPGSKARRFTLDGRYALFSCSNDGRYVIIQDADPVLYTQFNQEKSVYLYDSDRQSLSLESIGGNGTPLLMTCEQSFVSDDGRS